MHSDLATTSFDSFTVLDTHSFSAYVAGSAADSTSADSWVDYGYDDNVLAVTGTESSTGCSYSFIDTDSREYVYVLGEVVTGGTDRISYDLTIVASSETEISGTASGSPDPYSFISWSTDCYSETDSGASTTTLGEVNDFSDEFNDSDGYEYTLTGPPAGTITDVDTTSISSSGGDPKDSLNGTLIPAYWDTYAQALATSLGSSPVNAPVQDGTTSGEWDTDQGLVSAIGGQDMHALQFTGSEIQPGISGSAVVIKQGGGGSSIWASHPSAIGYRRQGYVNTGSHGGGGSGATITIDAVAPEFDSGMNVGTDGEEMERLVNFNQGAEENPTVAQAQPTSRAVQQTAVVGPGGAPLSVPGAPPAANLGNSMNVGGLTGYDLMMENAGILDALGILPPGLGGGGIGGGGGNGPIGQSPFSNQMGPASPGRSPGQTVPRPPATDPKPPPLYPPDYVPGPGQYSTANEDDPSLAGAAIEAAAAGALAAAQQPGLQTEPDVLASIPGADATPTAPLYEGYGWEFLKTLQGEGDAVVDTVSGVGYMIWHPILTAQGLWRVAQDPVSAGIAVGQAVRADLESGSRGQGKVAGNVILTVFGPSTAAKSVSGVVQTVKLVKVARLSRFAEAATEVISLEGVDLAEGMLAAGESATSALSGPALRTNARLVQEIATRAESKIGGTGRLAGIDKHTYAKNLLDRYQSMFGDRGLQTEIQRWAEDRFHTEPRGRSASTFSRERLPDQPPFLIINLGRPA